MTMATHNEMHNLSHNRKYHQLKPMSPFFHISEM